MARVFSQKHTSTFVGNVGIYSVSTESVHQIGQSGKTKYFTGVSWEGLIHETLVKTTYLYPVLTLCIPVMCRAHASLRGKLTRDLPMKAALVFNCLESSHSLSFTHNPYK